MCGRALEEQANHGSPQRSRRCRSPTRAAAKAIPCPASARARRPAQPAATSPTPARRQADCREPRRVPASPAGRRATPMPTTTSATSCSTGQAAEADVLPARRALAAQWSRRPHQPGQCTSRKRTRSPRRSSTSARPCGYNRPCNALNNLGNLFRTPGRPGAKFQGCLAALVHAAGLPGASTTWVTYWWTWPPDEAEQILPPGTWDPARDTHRARRAAGPSLPGGRDATGWPPPTPVPEALRRTAAPLLAAGAPTARNPSPPLRLAGLAGFRPTCGSATSWCVLPRRWPAGPSTVVSTPTAAPGRRLHGPLPSAACRLAQHRRAERQSIAELVRTDSIDVLIDLTRHTARNRLLAFRPPNRRRCRRRGLRYESTTGLEAMDYLIADERLVRPARETVPGRRAAPAGRLRQLRQERRTRGAGPPPSAESRPVTFAAGQDQRSCRCPRSPPSPTFSRHIPGSRLVLKYEAWTTPPATNAGAFVAAGLDLRRMVLAGAWPRTILYACTRIDIALTVPVRRRRARRPATRCRSVCPS